MGGVPRHVVIPVADEPSNPSLPYALATIRKHTDYIPVTVGKDHGLTELHIPTVQDRDKFTNTDLAMRTACETEWVSDPFVWWMDDVFIFEPASIPDWHMGQLPHTIDPTSSSYHRRKVETRRILETLGLPTLDYELHTPLLVHQALMLEALAIGGDKRTIYGNLQGTGTYHPDVKTRSEDRHALSPGPYVSTTPRSWRIHRTTIVQRTATMST